MKMILLIFVMLVGVRAFAETNTCESLFGIKTSTEITISSSPTDIQRSVQNKIQETLLIIHNDITGEDHTSSWVTDYIDHSAYKTMQYVADLIGQTDTVATERTLHNLEQKNKDLQTALDGLENVSSLKKWFQRKRETADSKTLATQALELKTEIETLVDKARKDKPLLNERARNLAWAKKLNLAEADYFHGLIREIHKLDAASIFHKTAASKTITEKIKQLELQLFNIETAINTVEMRLTVFDNVLGRADSLLHVVLPSKILTHGLAFDEARMPAPTPMQEAAILQPSPELPVSPETLTLFTETNPDKILISLLEMLNKNQYVPISDAKYILKNMPRSTDLTFASFDNTKPIVAEYFKNRGVFRKPERNEYLDYNVAFGIIMNLKQVKISKMDKDELFHWFYDVWMTSKNYRDVITAGDDSMAIHNAVTDELKKLETLPVVSENYYEMFRHPYRGIAHQRILDLIKNGAVFTVNEAKFLMQGIRDSGMTDKFWVKKWKKYPAKLLVKKYLSKNLPDYGDQDAYDYNVAIAVLENMEAKLTIEDFSTFKTLFMQIYLRSSAYDGFNNPQYRITRVLIPDAVNEILKLKRGNAGLRTTYAQ